MSLCAKDYKASGFVLITALLYLSVITIVISYALNSSLLQTKISGNMMTQAWAFENAESALVAGENAVQIDLEQGAGQINANSEYSFIKLVQQECAASYYQVNGIGRNRNAKVQLQSLLLVPLNNQDNCQKKYMSKNRLSWVNLSAI